MSYYSVKNYIKNETEFFVPDEETRLNNLHIPCFIGDKTTAEARVIEIKSALLAQENYRFSICKEVISGNNTVWMAALDNDAEDHVYYVFDSINGVHVQAPSFSAAIAKRDQLKAEFIAMYDWSVKEITKLPDLPIVTNAIPVEAI